MAVFVISHIALARFRLKAMLVNRFGRTAYVLGYSILSVVLMGWVIWALRSADRLLLWAAPQWGYGVAVLLTCVSFILIGIGAMTPNPFSVAVRNTAFNPKKPGFIGWMRHPIIWGLSLWGAAHLPVNGDWPSVVLFGGSAAFGAIGVARLERRKRDEFGAGTWQRMTRARGHIDRCSIYGLLVGLVLWLGFLALHPILFGVDPLAMALSGIW